MKLAGVLAIVLGVFLGFMYFNDQIADANNAASNISKGFDAMNHGAPGEFDRMMRESDEHHQSENMEGIAGAVAVIGGIAMVGKASSDKKRLDALLAGRT